MAARDTVPGDLPELRELGSDLLTTGPVRRWLTTIRPFLWAGFFWVAAVRGWWPVAVVAMAGLFIAIVASAHDLAHRSLGLPRRVNDLLLCLIGLLVLESGHAYRATHLQHHRTFPHDDDPEGDPAHSSFWGAVWQGPTFLFRLWWWAWQRAPHDRRWLALEGGWFVVWVVGALIALPVTTLPLIYAVLVIVGSWSYPLATVYLPHNVDGKNALFQTLTLRGRIVPRIFLELTYHLEHHLYPAVPSHHYAELATRLEPYLQAKGVEPVRVL